MKRRREFGVAAALAMVALTGCTTYHRVEDRSTGATFYTTNWDLHRFGTSDAVRLRDHTGSLHTIDDADVMEITESMFRDATGG